MKMAYAFEDMAAGQHFDCGAYEVTRDEILEFARKYDPQPFHTDEAAATQTIYRGLIASGWHTCAVAMRRMYDGFLKNAAAIGSPGFGEIRFIKPVRPGDILEVSFEVLEVTPSRSRPDRGIVVMRSETRNQRDEVLQVVTARLIVPRRA